MRQSRQPPVPEQPQPKRQPRDVGAKRDQAAAECRRARSCDHADARSACYQVARHEDRREEPVQRAPNRTGHRKARHLDTTGRKYGGAGYTGSSPRESIAGSHAPVPIAKWTMPATAATVNSWPNPSSGRQHA